MTVIVFIQSFLLLFSFSLMSSSSSFLFSFFYIISARIYYEIKLFWRLVLDFMEGILLRKNSEVAVLLMLWQVFLLSFLCN